MTGRDSSARPGRLKVLVNALVCAPDEGSEPGAGWWWTVAAAERHDVWLVTLDTSRARIDAALAARPDLAVTPVYVTQPRWLPGPSDDLRAIRLRYLVWQRQAVRLARALHAEVGFDVAHHLTLASDWLPSAVTRLVDVPFVWGPVGGYTRPAWPLVRWLGPGWLLDEAARRAITGAGRRFTGRRLARRAAVVVAQNPDAAGPLRRFRGGPVHVEPNVAIDPATLAARRIADPTGAYDGRHATNVVFAGRLVGWKGARLAITALARPSLAGWHLQVYGDGPDRAALTRLAERLGVAERVHLHGTRPREEVLGALGTADALLLPSLNDSAGWVVAEATALGCPVVCLDRGGPQALVADGPGAVVPAQGDVPAGLAGALLAVGGRCEPSPRWGRDRLAEIVDRWYTEALRTRQGLEPFGAAAPGAGAGEMVTPGPAAGGAAA